MDKEDKTKLIQNRLVVTKGEGHWGWAKWVKGVYCTVTEVRLVVVVITL